MSLLTASAALVFMLSASPAIEIVPPRDPAKVIELPVPVARLVTLNLSAMGEVAGCSLSPTRLADLETAADRKSARFVASQPGRYPVVVWSDGAASWYVLVAGNPEPEPTPVPPRPVDPLIEHFRQAFESDGGTAGDKARTLADLAELYKQSSEFAKSADSTSVRIVVGKVQAASKSLGISGLQHLREAIAGTLGEAFPNDAELTPDQRAKLVALFLRIAMALLEILGK